MRKYFFLTCALAAFAAAGCSSGGGDDIPDIAGNYTCSSGCTGACDFSSALTIIQDGENIIVETGAETGTGTVNDQGEFSYTLESGNCDGLFVQGTAVADCELNGVDCQQVTFKR